MHSFSPDELTNTFLEQVPRGRDTKKQVLKVLKSGNGSLHCLLFVINMFVDRLMFC